VAGFASTIFMPLTAVLAGRYGWRTALLTLATLYGAVTIPLHACVIRRPPRPPAATRHPSQRERTIVVQTALRDRRFWWLGIAFVAHGAAMSTMTVHLVGFLVHKGHPATFAATVAGLLGVLSVTGRLLLTAAQRRLRLTTVVAAIFTIQAGAAISLPIVGHSRIGAAIAIVAFGIGFGAASLVTPILLAERYGTTAYATIAGTLTTPVTLAKATAPLAAAGLLGATGYLPVLAAISASCLLAAVGITARASSPPPGQRGDVAGPATSAIPAGAGSRDGDADLRRLH
jgi:predicted MFS family arabinose efflux permease